MKRLILAVALATSALHSNENVLVKLTSDIPYINIKDNGVNIKIERIQDSANRLTDDFTRTSRLCPPHCIPKIKIVNGVETIGELELIDFIKNKVYKKSGILVDARLKGAYQLETIPGAINIPFTVIQVESKRVTKSLFNALGAKVNSDGTYSFSSAKELAIFCSGLWCKSSVKLVKGLVDKGYPKDKIKFYRGGLQSWKLLGLTTVVHKAVEVSK